MARDKLLNLKFKIVAEEELGEDFLELIQKAKEVSKQAYAPYSNYLVGAAVKLEDGEIIVGSNQENAAYPSGLCAERVAFFTASTSYPNKRIVAAAVVAAKGSSDKFSLAAPCGSCRQVMLEYETNQQSLIPLIMVYEEGYYLISSSISDLLPFGFNKFNLL